jgi:hypothetical protein
MQRLQSSKAEVSDHLDQIRAATRFEPAGEGKASLDALEPTGVKGGGETTKQKPAAPSLSDAAKPQAENYTERLLKAKKKVWEDRNEHR